MDRACSPMGGIPYLECCRSSTTLPAFAVYALHPMLRQPSRETYLRSSATLAILLLALLVPSEASHRRSRRSRLGAE